jgi:hypothetical protein
MADQLTPEQLQAIAAAQLKITAEQQKQKQLTGDLADAYDAIENKLDSISSQINNQLKNQGASVRQVSEIKSIYTSLNKTNKELQYLNDKFYEGTLKTKDIAKQLNQLDRTETILRRQINVATDQGNRSLVAKLKYELRILDLERKEGEELKKQNEYVDKRVGLTGKLLGGLEKIPILGDAIDFEEINTSMRNAVGNTNVFGAGLKTAGKQLKEGLKDPLVQFALLTAFYAKIVKSAYEFDELNTKTGRTLGLSKKEAEGLYNASFKYANSAHDSFVTAKHLVESQQKLNEALGTSVNLGDKNAEGFARLTHYYGLSEDSAAKLTEAAAEQGKNSLDILKTTTKTFGIQKAQFGGTISLNKVLDKVANVSDDIYIKFKGNTQAIAAAVMQSDRLGLSLEQTSQIGETLLNFESSIENELKAELLTGKAINLEKAREYALMGDTANLTKEVVKQVGNIHQFEKMNVIQRKAYAEAFGMSVQDMAKMLRKQEFEAKLAGSTAKSAKEKLEYAEKHGITIDDALRSEYEQKSIADEQREVFSKINEIIGKLTKGPMATFIHMLEGALEKVNSIFEAFGKFTGGALGSALGTAILAAPLLIGGVRLLAGGMKSLLLGPRGSSPLNPMHVTTDGMGGISGPGGGGVTDMLKGGTTFSSRKALVSKFGASGARRVIGGMKGFGAGMAIDLASMGIASQMDEGAGKDTVEGVGTVASYAGTGAMLGSFVPVIGNVAGGIIGGAIGLFKTMYDSNEKSRERDEAKAKATEESQKRTNDLLEQLAVRPVKLTVSNKEIGEWNTASNMYSGNQSSFN